MLSVSRRGLLSLVLIVAVSASAAASATAASPSGTLTVAFATLFEENLNPLFGPAPSKVFYDVMYDYLLYNHPQSLKLEPGLAERWSMSQDGKRWVFFLREGVTFSDGTELTADDVKFSLELLVRKESRWPFRSTFLRTDPKVLDRHTIAWKAPCFAQWAPTRQWFFQSGRASKVTESPARLLLNRYGPVPIGCSS